MYFVAWESPMYGGEWESFDGLDEAAAEYSKILEGGREDIDNVRSVSLCSVIHSKRVYDMGVRYSGINEDLGKALATMRHIEWYHRNTDR